jgi:hypothetical protein
METVAKFGHSMQKEASKMTAGRTVINRFRAYTSRRG